MPKTVSTDLATHIGQEVTTLCTLWHITRKDNKDFYFTDHDSNIIYQGNTYLSAVGYNRTAVSNTVDLSVDNLNVTGFIDSSALTENELRAGLFDKARISVYVVNWADLTQGTIQVRRGWIGEVTVDTAGMFSTELRGMTQAYSQHILETYQPLCRADLGDARCKVDLTPFTDSATVATVSDLNRTFTVTTASTHVDNWYKFGSVNWVTGDNKGLAMEVKAWTLSSKTIELFLAMPFEIKVGDTLNMIAGCDKTLHGVNGCFTKFNNVVNRRAEDFVPGLDALVNYPDAH